MRKIKRMGWVAGVVAAAMGAAGFCGMAMAGEGDGFSEAAVKQFEGEIKAGIKERGLEGILKAYQDLLAKKLDDSTGAKSWGDKTGNCRLNWVDHLLRNPLTATSDSEKFTRELHGAVLKDELGGVLDQCADKLDLKVRGAGGETPGVTGTMAGLAATKLEYAVACCERAMAPLTAQERVKVRDGAYATTTGNARIGARLPDMKGSREIFDLLEKMDRAEYVKGAKALITVARPGFAARVAAGVKKEGAAVAAIPGVDGAVDGVIQTKSGKILIGGAGMNVYRLDELTDVIMVIDVGGNDVYEEGTLSEKRPVLVIVDLEGKDIYRGTKPGIQGGAVLGVSVLMDAQGDDVYIGGDVAQGACVGGVGVLIDNGGNDTYNGYKRVQGSAIAGVGLLVDRAGNDAFRGALFAQGVGGPLGLGLLDDLDGADTYYGGGLLLDGYDDSPGYDGFSQGCGYGPRGVANGGLGVLLDGGGDDTYESDYFSMASGYWFAAGFSRDFGGNDKRFGATRTAYDGGPRKEARFMRYGVCFGCHYALGFMFDDAGDDFYGGSMAGHGFAWDFSHGALCDFGGNDVYDADGANMQGVAQNAGFGLLLDVSGKDKYKSSGSCQGYANPKLEYHKELKDWGNFSFLVDWSGEDTYSSGAKNNTVTEQGSKTGFVIDREKRP
jgi:hypothetical protein